MCQLPVISAYFTKCNDIIALCFEDCIIILQTKKEADIVYAELEKRKSKLTDEGTTNEYLRILITHGKEGSY